MYLFYHLHSKISIIKDPLPPFWPPLRGVRRFGEITVEQDRSYEEAGCLVRLFSLIRREERRRVREIERQKSCSSTKNESVRRKSGRALPQGGTGKHPPQAAGYKCLVVTSAGAE